MRNPRARLLLVLGVALWLRLAAPMAAAPFPDDCAEVCSSSTECTDLCFPDELAFINGNYISCLQWGDYATPCCGDGVCDNGEECSADCEGGGGCTGEGCGDPGEDDCGDGQCTGNEDCDSCPQDCSGQCGYCGDGICAANEYGGGGSGNPPPCNVHTEFWCSFCPEDCGACNPYVCDPAVCEDQYGQCKACTSDGECAYGDEACLYGTCVTTAQCTPGTQGDQDCQAQFGSGWVCAQSGVCRPQN